MDKTRVLVRVEPDREFDKVVEDLEAQGLEVDGRIDRARTVAGVAEESKIEALQNVAGVSSVRADRPFVLPVMGEKVPQ